MPAAVLAKLVLGTAVGGGLLYLLAGNSNAANNGGGGKDLLSCTEALAKLPAELRAPAQAALNAPQTATNRVAANALATSLDNTAKGTSVPADVRNALQVVVTCLRNYAKLPPDDGGGGGGGGLDLLSCDAALAKLDPVMAATAKSLLAGPKNADTAKQLRTLALTFESSAAIAPDAARAPLQTAAQCLRIQADAIDGGPGGGGPSTAGVIYDPDGTPSSWNGGPPQAGKASNPKYQWRHEVLAGESAWVITTHVFGAGANWTRVIQLIQNNPKDYYGRPLGTVGDPKNPQTTGYNFASLKAGDVLAIPKSWNAWIDQEGTDRNAPTPYPNP